MNVLGEFVELFSGSDVAYGEWVQTREAKALTRHGKPSEKQYEEHLDGITGLGVVPVNSEGVSRFGAIDLDIDSIDHAKLFQDVSQRNMPLHVCRSKSGGAHLYMFARAPGLPAVQLRQVLTKWAIALGYATAEIFPKQNRSSEENVGNWINLPYFGGDATTRYCVGPAGAMTLEQFFRSIQYYSPNIIVRDSVASIGLPPCLAALQERGITQGARNATIFNFAVFYRKSDPENWQERVRLQNSQFTNPPLPVAEIAGIIQSTSRATYQYTCEQEPLRGVCDRAVCVTLPYGISNVPWQEKNSFDELIVTNCRKLLSTPPRYTVEVNGLDISFTWEELFKFVNFKNKVGATADIVIASRKQPAWEQVIRGLLAKKVDIEAPDDASMIGLIIDKLHEFLVLRERATEKEDILRGLPIQDGEHVLFRAVDFKRHLQNAKLDGKIEQNDLFLALRGHGVTHRRIRLNGRLTMVWMFPVKLINEQTADFKVPDFKTDLQEEV